jgi:NADH-quinone oxidoreductase subunit J
MEPIHLILPISLFTFITFVFLSKNPVYGVLSFVVIVVHIVILLILLDLEFLAYILAIVYIGAIVVLFLFVIMMFYIYNFSTKRAYFRGLFEYFILGCLIGNVAYCIAFAREDKYLDYATVVFNDNLITLFA